jgi:hypothetical protein
VAIPPLPMQVNKWLNKRHKKQRKEDGSTGQRARTKASARTSQPPQPAAVAVSQQLSPADHPPAPMELEGEEERVGEGLQQEHAHHQLHPLNANLVTPAAALRVPLTIAKEAAPPSPVAAMPASDPLPPHSEERATVAAPVPLSPGKASAPTSPRTSPSKPAPAAPKPKAALPEMEVGEKLALMEHLHAEEEQLHTRGLLPPLVLLPAEGEEGERVAFSEAKVRVCGFCKEVLACRRLGEEHCAVSQQHTPTFVYAHPPLRPLQLAECIAGQIAPLSRLTTALLALFGGPGGQDGAAALDEAVLRSKMVDLASRKSHAPKDSEKGAESVCVCMCACVRACVCLCVR